VDRKYRTLIPAAWLDEARSERSLGLIHTFEALDHVSTLLAALATSTYGETI
jgi:hypothetical protein